MNTEVKNNFFILILKYTLGLLFFISILAFILVIFKFLGTIAGIIATFFIILIAYKFRKYFFSKAILEGLDSFIVNLI